MNNKFIIKKLNEIYKNKSIYIYIYILNNTNITQKIIKNKIIKQNAK